MKPLFTHIVITIWLHCECFCVLSTALQFGNFQRRHKIAQDNDKFQAINNGFEIPKDPTLSPFGTDYNQYGDEKKNKHFNNENLGNDIKHGNYRDMNNEINSSNESKKARSELESNTTYIYDDYFNGGSSIFPYKEDQFENISLEETSAPNYNIFESRSTTKYQSVNTVANSLKNYSNEKLEKISETRVANSPKNDSNEKLENKSESQVANSPENDSNEKLGEKSLNTVANSLKNDSNEKLGKISETTVANSLKNYSNEKLEKISETRVANSPKNDSNEKLENKSESQVANSPENDSNEKLGEKSLNTVANSLKNDSNEKLGKISETTVANSPKNDSGKLGEKSVNTVANTLKNDSNEKLKKISETTVANSPKNDSEKLGEKSLNTVANSLKNDSNEKLEKISETTVANSPKNDSEKLGEKSVNTVANSTTNDSKKMEDTSVNTVTKSPKNVSNEKLGEKSLNTVANSLKNDSNEKLEKISETTVANSPKNDSNEKLGEKAVNTVANSTTNDSNKKMEEKSVNTVTKSPKNVSNEAMKNITILVLDERNKIQSKISLPIHQASYIIIKDNAYHNVMNTTLSTNASKHSQIKSVIIKKPQLTTVTSTFLKVGSDNSIDISKNMTSSPSYSSEKSISLENSSSQVYIEQKTEILSRMLPGVKQQNNKTIINNPFKTKNFDLHMNLTPALLEILDQNTERNKGVSLGKNVLSVYIPTNEISDLLTNNQSSINEKHEPSLQISAMNTVNGTKGLEENYSSVFNTETSINQYAERAIENMEPIVQVSSLERKGMIQTRPEYELNSMDIDVLSHLATMKLPKIENNFQIDNLAATPSNAYANSLDQLKLYGSVSHNEGETK